MLRLKVWHWIVLIIFIPFVLGSKCSWFEPKTEPPPPPVGCGVGTGEYKFSMVGTVPDTFDCNNSGRFVITISPSINPSYYGIDIFNRLYFVLDNGRFCISNYVEFLSDNYEAQQLEWGGSLPTGDYEVRGRMKNIQLNSTCRDSIYKAAYKDLGWIHITEFSNPEKVMYIEYDCQESDTFIITHYDVFLSPNTAEYMDIAFNIANTRYTIDSIANDYDPELIRATDQKVKEYIAYHKQFDDEMYLGGIKGFKDGSGTYLYYITGWAIWDSITNAPNCSTGSLVAVKACIDIVAPEYKIDYNDFVTATTIHELGHQRGSLTHFDHDSEFCIMNWGLVVVDERNRYSNPHFCNTCINKLKNVGW